MDEDRLQKFCDYCGIRETRRFTDSREFLRQAEMDAVIITTPEFTHKDVAIEAMQAGKHVYLEKAMATTSDECRAIIRAHRRSGVIGYLGFNLREVNLFRRIKETVDSGVLGQIIHLSGSEQLSVAHSASFMRRFHRRSKQSGGFLNTKCSHDLDFMQWLVGHQHRIIKVASFGGTNVFLPEKGPIGRGKSCHECPASIQRACPYRDQAGFVFPVTGAKPIHKTQQTEVYGGDLCVYHDDKDIVDNQTVIFEWDHGVRGNFNLQLFQRDGRREIKVWGEKGLLEADTSENIIRVIKSDACSRASRRPASEGIEQKIENAPGGHGGSDKVMLKRFLDAIENREQPESGFAEGLAATLLAEKADESRLSGQVVKILPNEYL